jgi:hypothetical protein
MNDFGFIITRHVNSEKTNNYWNQSVKCLRMLYPFKKIVIIDDNSNQNYLKDDFKYKNVEIIKSEFKGRGELLPYYYYLKYKWFDNAVVIHDSVFFHKRILFEKLIGINALPLWYFHADTENIENTKRITNKLKLSQNIQKILSLNDKILDMFDISGKANNKWYGCFGVQSFINHRFLTFLENKYNISKLVDAVQCRADRCCLERIFGCLFFIENKNTLKIKSVFGNIQTYHKWGYSYDQYENDFKHNRVPRHVIKVWTGR